MQKIEYQQYDGAPLVDVNELASKLERLTLVAGNYLEFATSHTRAELMDALKSKNC